MKLAEEEFEDEESKKIKLAVEEFEGEEGTKKKRKKREVNLVLEAARESQRVVTR